MRLLIADHEPIYRRGLKDILSEESEFDCVEEAGNAAEVQKAFRRGKWDVVILEGSLPGKSFLDLLKDLKQEAPEAKMLVLDDRHNDECGIRSLKAGARGCISKECSAAEIVSAVRRVLSGGKYIDAETAERLANQFGSENDDRLPHERLSDREFQVMNLIGQGKTATEIAKFLHLSVKTVSTYRTRILDKMKMRNNLELMHYSVHQETSAPVFSPVPSQA